MAFNVRIYGHDGLTRMKVLGASQFSSDSVHQLNQPYLWAQTISVSAVAAASAANALPAGKTTDNTDVLYIEVPDGAAIRYEVNPPGRSIVAASGSPRISGTQVIKFGPSWTVSMIDASGLP